MNSVSKPLTRSRNRVIAGVCGGVADYFNINLIMLRLIFVGLIFLNGVGLLLYLILFVVIPAAPSVDEGNASHRKGSAFSYVAWGVGILAASLTFTSDVASIAATLRDVFQP